MGLIQQVKRLTADSVPMGVILTAAFFGCIVYTLAH